MSPWILQHFLNPAMFWPAAALIAVPIIIHLIHRLRYRRVRFAAMEFLLASQRRNQQRVFFEQLLLLLSRIALIILLGLLIARFMLDPGELSLFQGAKSHHVIVLDDSASMQDRGTDGSVFDDAKDLVRRIVAEGAQRPGTQQLTLILMSRPRESLAGLSERDIDDALLTEVIDRLEILECTHRSCDPAEALEAALERLQNDRAVERVVHVLSDFRRRDWFDNKAAATAMRGLAEIDAGLNLVRCVGTEHQNLGIVGLEGDIEVAAAGVPVEFRATVQNFGERTANDVRAQIFVNGQRLPRTVDLETVPAGESVTRSFSVVFDRPMAHTLALKLADDPYPLDDERHLAVDVPVDNPVLVIDGSRGADQALFVADALAADTSVTGMSAVIHSPEDLRKMELNRFHAIYLLNVAELAPDALVALKDYVARGGGLAWFLGDQVRPAFYNDQLYAEGAGLFPVQLESAPAFLPRLETDSSVPDIVPGDNDIFRILTGEENPFLDAVIVNHYYAAKEDEEGAETAADTVSTVEVLATLRNGDPFMLEHEYGAGRVLTCMTTAGPLIGPNQLNWNNWANGPGKISYVVMQLELAKAIARRDRSLPPATVGEPIARQLNRAEYRDEVEVITPDDQATRVRALPPEQAGVDGEEAAADDVSRLELTFRETDEPGFYRLTLLPHDREPEVQLYAYNVPISESELPLVKEEQLRRELGEDVAFSLQPFGEFEWIRSESPGYEMRWALLMALLLIGMAEQWMASRFSYQGD